MATSDRPAAAGRAKGGGFLIEETRPEDVFTPEDFTGDHRQIAKTATEFTLNEVMPAMKEIEEKNLAVTKGLLRRAGELGLLAVDIPEQYGGLEMDKVSSAVVTESISKLASFAVAFAAHTCIGTLPIVWYGTPKQKQKYLPKLASGEWIAAYALSEASSGSDALNCRARASLSADGRHYILNGEKMWITNAGLADVFTVFVKIDGEKFSAFLVDRNTPGLSIGAEEHKLGIWGASTCPLVLSDCKVAAENLLGEPGRGQHIAFNVLNIGRLKLGAACAGGARYALQDGIQYARDRKAFGKPICEFGLIQEKLADAASGIYAGESMVYRTSGMLDAALAGIDTSAEGASQEIQKRIEEYAVECSILKVWGSEMLDMVVDHVVQIFGGYGYVEEYPAARSYRDSRVNRIFEGTNEINRLIITGWLMKRAMAGQLPLLQAIKRVMDEVMYSSGAGNEREGPLAGARQMLANAKKLFFFAAGAASQKYAQNLADQQEVMGALADCVMETYALESCVLRAEKMLAARGPQAARPAVAMTSYYAEKAFDTVVRSSRKVIAASAEGDTLRTQLAILRRLVKQEPADTIGLGREIARHVIETGRYAV
ncbi:MAG TPA: acyl-CoA dehydrogenase family protein [Bryobacteraceae bacterium]|nr:acyl-CoA dehydrogenase family protein [Bryobacteraceae bacterium]HPU73365.1 acyl-CoA dehydrogenase family protein [Bryobacteraceae bacterium]